MFAYFTGEIFARARPENRRTLMLAALLPSVTAEDAEMLSGNPDALRLFEHLYRRHLFVDRRRAGERNVYSFHGLFREFLLAEGRVRLSVDERSKALARAARLLVERGDVDAAASIYRDACAWPELAACGCLRARGRAQGSLVASAHGTCTRPGALAGL